MSNTLKIYIIVFFLFSVIQATANRKLNIEIEFPESIIHAKVKILLDNGLKERFIPVVFIGNRILINDTVSCLYTTLIILYPNINERLYGIRVLVNSKAFASILFKEVSSTIDNQLSSYVLRNVIGDSKCKEALKLMNFTKPESDSNYYSNQYNLLKTDSSLNYYNTSITKLALKQLEYVKNHGDNYYYFSIFRLDIVPALLRKYQNELYEIFNNTFPKKFKKSYEGKNLKALIEGNLFIKKGNHSPEFEVNDYKGASVSLSSFRGKYVLLSFWATWCGPCLKEIPLLQEIRKNYSPDKLEIISVSYDSDTSAFIKGINALKMDWINIYSNNNLRNLFGNKPIPSLYLIDQNGIIISSNWEDGEIKFPEALATKIRD